MKVLRQIALLIAVISAANETLYAQSGFGQHSDVLFDEGKIQPNLTVNDSDTPVRSDHTWYFLNYNSGIEYNKTYAFSKMVVDHTYKYKATSFSGDVSLENILGGTCGPSNTGGTGFAQPVYQTSFHILSQSKPGSWHLNVGVGGMNNRGLIEGAYKVNITGASYSKIFSFNYDSAMHYITDILPAGNYTIVIYFAKMTQGCRGEYPGTFAQADVKTTISFQVDYY